MTTNMRRYRAGKRHRETMVALILSVLTAIALTACGDGGDAPEPSAAPVAVASPDPTPTPTPVPAPVPAEGRVGVWEEVTPPDADPQAMAAFGLGSIVVTPGKPNEMYLGGYGTIFKSVDYGLTWSKVPSNPNPGSQALGQVIAVAGTTPTTVWVANGYGDKHIYKSIDGGLTFRLTGDVPGHPGLAGFYSLTVDPNNYDHLVSGLHEAGGIVESFDGGETWRVVGGTGFPSAGVSWYVFFINTGNPATTSTTWFAIAQNGGSGLMTRDGGRNWVVPKGIEGLEHPHGNAGILQVGDTLFATGIYGVHGSGTYRSIDQGMSWMKVHDQGGGVVFGSAKNVYSVWGWACSRCTADQFFYTAAMPGDRWRAVAQSELPARFNWGPNSVATTSDGLHTIHVGSMWAAGIWRYIEP